MSAGVLSLRTVHVAAVWGRGPAVCSVGGSGAVHMVAGVGWPGRSEAFGQSERHTWLSWCGMCAARVSMELSVRRLLLRSVFAAFGRWREHVQERLSSRSRISAAGACFSTEGRLCLKAVMSWVEAAALWRSMRLAASAW